MIQRNEIIQKGKKSRLLKVVKDKGKEKEFKIVSFKETQNKIMNF